MVLMANAAYEVQILALLSHDLLAGNITAATFAAMTTRAAFVDRLNHPQHSPTPDGTPLSINCLDPMSTTYSPDGDLHQATQCLYSDSSLIAALESMNTSEWIIFLLQAVRAPPSRVATRLVAPRSLLSLAGSL